MKPFKTRSRVAVGVARNRTLTAKNRKWSAKVYICNPVTGNGESRRKAEKIA
jgi:hypothetical protein